MLHHGEALATVSPGAQVTTSFNGTDNIKQGESVVRCVCGCTFIAHSGTQTCVVCNSYRLTVLIHCP